MVVEKIKVNKSKASIEELIKYKQSDIHSKNSKLKPNIRISTIEE
jgi:hypothetical protein